MFHAKVFNAFFLTTCLCYIPVLEADSYRCGRKVVRTGDSTARLLELCGEPRHRDRGREVIKRDGHRQETSVQRWYYKKSARSLERVVMIHKGRVAAIEVGSR